MPDIVTMGSTVRGFVGGRHTWSLDLDDISTGGICYFVDLDGNGVEEVMLRTEAATLIVDGEGGEVLATWPATTGTAFDGPVLLDVNGDRSTEIVVNCTDEYREGSECRGVVAWTHPTGSLAWFGPRWDGILGPYHGMQADGSYVWPPPPFWEVPELNGLNRVPVRDHACPGLAPVLEEVCEREDGMIFVTISLANPGFFDLDEKVSLDVRDADNGARLASVLFDPPGHDQTSEARTVGPLASASGRIDIATRYDASSAYARCDNSKLIVSWEPP